MNKMFKITGNEQDFPEFRQFHQLSSEFLPFAQKKLGFNKPVDINLVSDPENAKDPLGKTAYYDPNMMKITLFIDKRHVKDILRSLSHELVHHTQNCRGDFGNGVNIGEGNFTTNEALRELELEAYTKGSGATLREFEDYKKSMNESNSYLLNDSYLLKEKRHMSSVNETKLRKYVTSLIKDVLSEEVMPDITTSGDGSFPVPESGDCGPSHVKNEKGTRCVRATSEGKEITEEDVVEEGFPGGETSDPVCVDKPKEGCPDGTDEETVNGKPMCCSQPTTENLEKGVVEGEGKCPECKCPVCKCPPKKKSKKKSKEKKYDFMKGVKKLKPQALEPGGDGTAVVAENWLKGNKDQLLFEELVKKWAK